MPPRPADSAVDPAPVVDPPFDEALRRALQSLRASLVQILASVGSDAARPQDMARQFGLNKNLTWKLSKIVTGTDLFGAVPHIPGPSGMRIFLKAMSAADANDELIERVADAAAAFERVVQRHTGDRTTLEIMVNDMLPEADQGEQLQQSRKLAYQGNSGIWGVRARAQLCLNVLMPNADDPSLADLAQVGGLIGFRRLRSTARWLLFRRERWNDEATTPESSTASLDPAFPIDDGIPLLGAHCTAPLPPIRAQSIGDELQYELEPGPVGDTAAFTCVYGLVERGLGAVVADASGQSSEVGVNFLTPVEHVVFDLLVHRAFDWAMTPEFRLISRMNSGALQSESQLARNELPNTERIHDLGWGTTALATPLLPTYPALLGDVFAALDRDPADFRALRVTMAYPPIPALGYFRSPLPVRG